MKHFRKTMMTVLSLSLLSACSSASASAATSSASASGTAASAAASAASSTAAATDAVTTEFTVSDTETYDGYPLVIVDTSNADGVLKDVLDSGVLVVGTSPDFPPAEFVDDEGNVKGSEIMMAEYIAACLGVELQIEPMDFSAVLTSVDTGKVDLGMSGFGYKPDRAENFELSHGYIGEVDSESACQGLMVPADKVDEYQTLDDFAGLTIAAQATSLQEMYAQDQIPDVVIEEVGSLDQAVLNLASGKVDAVALTCTMINNYVAQSDGQYAKAEPVFDTSIYEDYDGTVAAAKKGETSLIEAVNVIVDYVNANNMYDTWYQEAKAEAGIE